MGPAYCAGDLYCLGSRCVEQSELDRYQHVGKAIMTTGLVALSVGVLGVGMAFVAYSMAPEDECDGLFEMYCGGKEHDSTEYKAFLGMLYAGGLLTVAGIVLTAIGARKVKHTKRAKEGHISYLVPFILPTRDGGMVGLGYLF
jgi:hypothetical protein